MKILYDYQAFQLQKVGGVSNCFAELIAHLPHSVEWEIGLCESNNIHLRDKCLIPNLKNESLNAGNFISDSHFFGKKTVYNYLNNKFKNFPSSEHINQRYSIELLKKQDYDVFHPTFFNPYFLDYIGKKPFVLTIHDLITDKFRSANHLQTIWRKTLLPRASHIVTVSEKTKQDVVDILNIPADKISVIYHGVSIPDDMVFKDIIGGKYFLYVGRRNTYKNFILMVKSMANFLINHPDYKLVCTANDFSKDEISLFEHLKIRNQIIHVFASYDELLSLYKYAKAFIFPSLYEGFGIPILEAYAMQCPVLLTEESCFPEIAGDAAIYFKLNEKEDTFRTVIDNFVNMDKEAINSLLHKQDRRLQKYSWEKSALQLTELYDNIISEKNK